MIIVGEIGINSNGYVFTAFELMKMAKDCGCDIVKFQKRDIETVYTKEFLDSNRKSPWGNTQRVQKEQLEFSEKEYDAINDYSHDIRIPWFASTWDLKSQYFIRKYKLKYNKIASPMLTHKELLKTVAEEKKLTFISTGMSTYDDIDFAVDTFRSYRCPFILLHCVSTYPCRDEDCNLNMISKLHERYNCRVGYSGHENGILPSLIAVALGAEVIERHITLDKTSYGSDQAASLDRKELKELIDCINKIDVIKGNGKKKITKEEREIAEKLRYFK
jgi:N-acetylneuraminate synthase